MVLEPLVPAEPLVGGKGWSDGEGGNQQEQRKRKTLAKDTGQPEIRSELANRPPISQTDNTQAPVSAGNRFLLKEENVVPLYRPKKPNNVKFQHYLYILNDTIKNFNDHLQVKARIKFDKLGPVWGSNIYASYWTHDEKNAFFNALSRFTKRDLYAVSKAVKTKSPMECRQYMDALEDGLDVLNNGNDYEDSERNRSLFHPAAREVSNEWLRMEAMCAAHAVREIEFETDAYLTDNDSPTLSSVCSTTYPVEDIRTAKGIWAFDALLDLNAIRNLAQVIYQMPGNAEEIHNVLPLVEERSIKRRKLEAGQPLLYTQLIEALTEEARWITREVMKATCLLANKRMFCQSSKRIVLGDDVKMALSMLGLAAEDPISPPTSTWSSSEKEELAMEAGTDACLKDLSEIEDDENDFTDDDRADSAREEYITVIDENRDIEADEFNIEYLAATCLRGFVKFPDEIAGLLPETFGRNQQ